MLTIAIAGYVFVWMRLADQVAPRQPLLGPVPQPSRRFVVLTVGFLLLFAAASPLYLESPRRRFLAGLAVLGITQMTGLLALHALASRSGLTARVSDIRGWAVAGPLLIVAAVVNVARPRR